MKGAAARAADLYQQRVLFAGTIAILAVLALGVALDSRRVARTEAAPPVPISERDPRRRP